MNLSRFYAIAQIEYCRNFIFKRHFPIHKIFERSCEIGLWRLTANRISEIFGVRLHKRLRGKLATVIDQIEHGHHVFRAYWKNAFLKQYEKILPLPPQQTLLQQFARLRPEEGAGPSGCRAEEIPDHHRPLCRFPEVLLHGGNTVGGWTAKQIHQAVLTTFRLSPQTHGLNQPRYDLRKLKGHGLLERDGGHYAYQLTSKGVQVALLFLFFHKRLCGPLANSRFHHQPDPAHRTNSKLEAPYHKADAAIQNIVDLLAAA